MQQQNQPCFLPNTIRDHASVAFNSYYQTYKHKGGSCYFKGAAMITELDPSRFSLFLAVIESFDNYRIVNQQSTDLDMIGTGHGSCHYEYKP